MVFARVMILPVIGPYPQKQRTFFSSYPLREISVFVTQRKPTSRRDVGRRISRYTSATEPYSPVVENHIALPGSADDQLFGACSASAVHDAVEAQLVFCAEQLLENVPTGGHVPV